MKKNDCTRRGLLGLLLALCIQKACTHADISPANTAYSARKTVIEHYLAAFICQMRGCGCGVNLTYSAMHGINIRRSRFKLQYSPFQKFTFRKFAPCHKVGKGLEFIFIGNNYADFFIF